TPGEAGSLDGQRVVDVSGTAAADDAFEAFFHLYEQEIFGYLWRITGDEHASYDLAQETFVRAWQRFEHRCDVMSSRAPGFSMWLRTSPATIGATVPSAMPHSHG